MFVQTREDPRGSLSKSEKGRAGELTFERLCVINQIPIAYPLQSNLRFDYIVRVNGTHAKVNVKTMYRYRNCYKVGLKTSNGAGKGRPYEEGEIDYFAVVNLDEKEQPIWMLPLDATNGKTALHWYPPDKPHRKQSNSFNWEPFVFPAVNVTDSCPTQECAA